MADRYRRPERRVRLTRTYSSAWVLCALGLGIVLTFMRSYLNLAIGDAAAALATLRATERRVTSEVEDLRVVQDGWVGVHALDRRALELGLAPAPPGAVTLLAATDPQVLGARPLQHAGALGRLLQHLYRLTAAPVAEADEGMPPPHQIVQASPAGAEVAAAQPYSDRCQLCAKPTADPKEVQVGH